MRLFRHLSDHAHGQHHGQRFARGPHHGPGHDDRHFGGGPRGGDLRGGDLRGGGFRRGRLARFLEHGDLKMLLLHLINAQPRHGYEIIKAIEDLTGGAYAPSPGVVYPTLTLLEELGHISSNAEGTRKNFTITEAGRESLGQNKAEVETILARIAGAQSQEPSPALIRAMENLKTALRLKLAGAKLPPETTKQIAALLDEAARNIEEL
jgi:DNA-binding PadR family transcriptional regulator